MPIIDGISCSVHTPEGPLEEFPCAGGTSPNSVSAYILARDGQEFSIECNAPSPYKHMPIASTDGLSIQLQIDRVNEQPMLLDHRHLTVTIDGTRVSTSTGNWELRKFIFSSVELTEERGQGELTLENVNKLGEIIVTVRRYKKLGMSGTVASGPDIGTKRVVIHEKTIKGRDISHSVRRAKGKYCAPLHTIAGTYIDPEDHPLMSFRFIYKSARALKNMDLIERSSSPPVHLNIERNTKPARPGTVKSEKGQLKRERDDSAGPSGRNKPRHKQRRGVGLGDIETIDLTSD